MNTLYSVTGLIYTLSPVFSLAFLANRLGFKEPRKRWAIIFIAAYCAPCALGIPYAIGIIDSNAISIAADILCLPAAVLMFCSLDLHWKQRLVLGAALIPLFLFLSGIDYILAELLQLPGPPAITDHRQIPAFAVFIVLSVALRLPFYHFLSSKIKSWNSKSVLHIAGIMIISTTLWGWFRLSDRSYILKNSRSIAILLMLFLLMFLIVTHIADRYKRHELQLHNKALAQAMESDRRYFLVLEQQQSQLNRLQHDINNHVTTIESLLETGNDKQAAECARELLDRRTKLINLDYCANPVANALLVNKSLRASEIGAAFSFNGELPEIEWLNPIDLISLLSNLIDNALEAAGAGGSIYLDSCYFGGALCIKCENSITLLAKGKSGLPASGKLIRGQGQGILRDLAQKYRGKLDYKSYGTVYSASVTLYAPKKAKAAAKQ